MIRVLDETVEEALRELSDERMQARLWTSSGGAKFRPSRRPGAASGMTAVLPMRWRVARCTPRRSTSNYDTCTRHCAASTRTSRSDCSLLAKICARCADRRTTCWRRFGPSGTTVRTPRRQRIFRFLAATAATILGCIVLCGAPATVSVPTPTTAHFVTAAEGDPLVTFASNNFDYKVVFNGGRR